MKKDQKNKYNYNFIQTTNEIQQDDGRDDINCLNLNHEYSTDSFNWPVSVITVSPLGGKC